jgi:hypothetical protein
MMIMMMMIQDLNRRDWGKQRTRRFPGRDINPGPPKYETRVLTAHTTLMHEHEEPRWNYIDRKNRRTRRKTSSSATLSTINLKWTYPGANQACVVRGQRLTTWAMERPWHLEVKQFILLEEVW